MDSDKDKENNQGISYIVLDILMKLECLARGQKGWLKRNTTMTIKYLKRWYPEDLCQGMELMYSSFRKTEYKGKKSTAKSSLIVEIVLREIMVPTPSSWVHLRKDQIAIYHDSINLDSWMDQEIRLNALNGFFQLFNSSTSCRKAYSEIWYILWKKCS